MFFQRLSVAISPSDADWYICNQNEWESSLDGFFCNTLKLKTWLEVEKQKIVFVYCSLIVLSWKLLVRLAPFIAHSATRFSELPPGLTGSIFILLRHIIEYGSKIFHSLRTIFDFLLDVCELHLCYSFPFLNVNFVFHQNLAILP